MPLPAGWNGLGLTSGRRTYLGNRKVGGVPNSAHLSGTAADFTAPLDVLRARFPNNPILDEGNHRHVSGLSDVPYYGNQGTAGLVNGVDTSAPQGKPMLNPRKKPAYSPPAMPLDDPGFGFNDAQQLNPNPLTLGGMSSMAQTPEVKRGGLFGSGLGFGDVLANGLVGFAAGMGNPAPLEAMQRSRIQEDDRNFARERLQAEIEARKHLAMQRAMEPTEFSQRIGELNAMENGLGNTYARNYANNGGGSFIQYVDPTTGQRMAINPQQMSAPQSQTIDGVTYYNIGGKWYDNPEGR